MQNPIIIQISSFIPAFIDGFILLFTQGMRQLVPTIDSITLSPAVS